MIFLETIAVALAMYSRIPVPRVEWNDKNMRYALCAFPLVGAIIGLAWYGIIKLDLPDILRGACLCLTPVIVTGGIHLDGYADTCDALSSFGDAETKRRILSDPHCGAFAVIRLCCYFTAYFALCTALEPTEQAVLCLGTGFVLERALSGLSVASFPLAKDTGLAHTFAKAADKSRVKITLLLLSALIIALQGLFCGVTGIVSAAVALIVFGLYRFMSVREFGGITGDLAGWFLQKCELWQLAAVVICQIILRRAVI